MEDCLVVAKKNAKQPEFLVPAHVNEHRIHKCAIHMRNDKHTSWLLRFSTKTDMMQLVKSKLGSNSPGFGPFM